MNRALTIALGLCWSAGASAHGLDVNQGRLQLNGALATLTIAPGEALPEGSREDLCPIVEAAVSLTSLEGRPEQLTCEVVAHHGHHGESIRLVVVQYQWPSYPLGLRLNYDLYSGEEGERMEILAVSGRRSQMLVLTPALVEVAVFSEEVSR